MPAAPPSDASGALAAARESPWLVARRFFSPRRLVRTASWLGQLAATIAARRREPRLTVAVDVNAFYEPLTGVGWYLHRLLAHLAHEPGLALRLYGQALTEGDPRTPSPVVTPPEGPAIERVVYDAPDGLVVPPWRARQLLRRLAPLLAAADGNRVLFAPNFLEPRLLRFARAARVATVHDLTLLRLPESARPDTAAAQAEALDRTLLTAAMLITPSEAVRGELVAHGVAPERVRAIHHGAGQLAGVVPGALPPGVPPRFGLFVGTLEPRKNLPLLLAAWRLLRRRRADAPPLVLCGGWGWKTAELQAEVARGTAEGWLVHAGYVGAPALAALYGRALLVALPSRYEGFGLPLVEAFAAGTPVVASDIPVLREVAGDAALLAPLDDVEAWARALERLVADEALRAELAARGRARAARFDWGRAAREHAAVLALAAAREGSWSPAAAAVHA